MKRRIFKIAAIAFLFISVIGLNGCDENNNIVLFSIQNDIDLGKQVSEEIAADKNTYPILDKSTNAEAYAYLEAVKNAILNSGEVAYKDQFVWQLHIIKDDETLNAFATPGGYIYVYTGLIKYLDNVDDLAGVMGHELAHADLRHTSRNIQKEKGVSFLISILLGDDVAPITQIAAELATGAAYLKFSRSFEEDADAKSVVYLAKTDYACNGAAGFFAKLLDSGQAGGTPEFLSTHPAEASRVTDINAKATEKGCDTTLSGNNTAGMTYADFQALL